MAKFNWETGKYEDTSTGAVTAITVNGELKSPDTEALALDELQTEKFYNTLKSYYSYRESDDKFHSMSHADLLDYFYNDRTWRNNQTVSMSMDLTNVMTENDPKRLEEFAYINETYKALPNWWNDPNRSFGGWLADMGGAMVLDPVNVIGFGIGGQAAKQAYKQALKEALKGKVAKEINERLLKEVQKTAQKEALKGAVKRGAIYEGMIGGGIAGVHDAMLQQTAITSNVQGEFDLKRMALSSAYGFGFGSIFGGAFSYGGFKWANRGAKNTAVRQLEDLHNYGRSDITGKRLFTDLADKKKRPQLYKNLTEKQKDEIEFKNKLQGETTAERIKNLRKTAEYEFTSKDKPPKRKFNYTRMKDGSFGVKKYLLNAEQDIAEQLDSGNVTFKEIEEFADRHGLDPKKLFKEMKEFTGKGKGSLAAQLLALDRLMLKNMDDTLKLANELERVNITQKEKVEILTELAEREALNNEIVVLSKQATEQVAVALASKRIERSALRAKELKFNPEDPKMKALKIADSEEYWKAVNKLTTDDQVIMALQNVRKVNKWDLASEYVNNNLLSSPDTHILNIISGLTQIYWKPAVMVFRGANMLPKDRARGWEIMREGFQTFTFSHLYTLHALHGFYRGFRMGRAILDPQQMKHDSNIRQGQLQRWINEMGDLWVEQPFGMVGKGINRAVIRPTSAIVTAPMRVLSAGDEFLKTMTFKARAGAMVNSRIMREQPELTALGGLLPSWQNKRAYKARYNELMKTYQETDGRAISTKDIKTATEADRLRINDPLEYARESTYTQSAHSVNPLTGKKEGGITGEILAWTARHRWSRAFGLHFINTPSNLLRWTFQHMPSIPFLRFTGKYQLQMRQMLAKDPKTGKYLNNEMAAEANARIQMGWLLWTSAFLAAANGKFTGGGSRDWKQNREREATTGWQPYSMRQEDDNGNVRYVSLNRLDPIFLPFFVAADIMEGINDFLETNEDLPEEVENKYTELAMVTMMSLTRNLTSKFYTKNILETAEAFLGDGLMYHRDPERVSGRFFARGFSKIVPLSSGIRYKNRITDGFERDTWDFADQIRTINPFADMDRTMPKRNMLGEVINRKQGWLFGLGGESGLWSTPFAMTEWKTSAIANFMKDREFEYRAPSKMDKHTNVNLREIRNSKGQTAYDRWLELKGTMTIKYKGKEYNLKQFIEMQIEDPRSKMYRLPTGVVAGDDARQKHILSIVDAFENMAYAQMWKEFPVLEKKLKIRNLFQIEKYKEASDNYFKSLK